MYKKKAVTLFVAVVCWPAIAMSQDARSILETMQEKQVERWEGVDTYVVNKTTMGASVETWYERSEVTSAGGAVQTAFMPVHPYRSVAAGCESGDVMTPEALEAGAGAMEMFGDATAAEIENGLEAAGLPRGLLAASGTDPTATFNPRVMMGSNAAFMRAAANAKREMAAQDPAADAASSLGEMEQFLDSAELVGTEEIDGHNAFHVRASGVDVVQEDGGSEYRMGTVSMWIDTEEYVPLLMRIDGTMTSGSESQAMTIENIQTDYRHVPDSNMYESFRQVVKISGAMDAAQQAEVAEAQAKMAEFEQQMAAMPESQRQMMEQMMGPQLEMMRKMVAGNAFQLETVTNSIRVNPDAVGTDCPTE